MIEDLGSKVRLLTGKMTGVSRLYGLGAEVNDKFGGVFRGVSKVSVDCRTLLLMD